MLLKTILLEGQALTINPTHTTMKIALLLTALSVSLAGLSQSAIIPTLLTAQVSAPSAARNDVEVTRSHDNAHLLSRDAANHLLIHNTATKELVGSVPLQYKDSQIALSPDSKMLAEASEKSITIYDTITGKKIKDITLPIQARADSIIWSPDGGLLLLTQLVPSSNNDGTYEYSSLVISPETSSVFYKTDNMPVSSSTIFHANSKNLISTASDGLYLLDLESGKKKTLLKGIAMSSQLAWNPDYSMLAVDSKHQSVIILDDAGEKLYTAKGPEGVSTMEWDSERGVLVITEGHQGVCEQHIVDVGAKKMLTKLSKNFADKPRVQISATGDYILAPTDEGYDIYDTRTEKKVKSIEDIEGSPQMYISPDAQQLLYFDPSYKMLKQVDVEL